MIKNTICASFLILFLCTDTYSIPALVPEKIDGPTAIFYWAMNAMLLKKMVKKACSTDSSFTPKDLIAPLSSVMTYTIIAEICMNRNLSVSDYLCNCFIQPLCYIGSSMILAKAIA